MSELTFTDFSALNKIAHQRTLVAFGAGNICSKTRTNLTKEFLFIVDNSANLWGTEQDGIRIEAPAKLLEYDTSLPPFVVICTTSFREVSEQLIDFGLKPELDFCVSPTLNDWRAIDKLESAQADLLFSSGLSSSGTTKGHGGLYRLKIAEGQHNLTQIHKGSAHGLIQVEDKIYFVDDELGIVELNANFKILRSGGFLSGSRAHGMTWSNETNSFYVACSYLDQVLEIDFDFNIRRRISISSKVGTPSGPHHHINDCLAWGNSLFVSMFSLTGNWKKDVFDGGILEIDLISGRPLGSVAEGLWMPHNIANIDGSMAVLDSLPGRLLLGNLKEIGRFPGFTRGLAWDSQFIYIGQSRNRNFSRQFGVSNNISLDSGIIVFDHHTKLSMMAQLPRHVTEIHAVFPLHDFLSRQKNHEEKV